MLHGSNSTEVKNLLEHLSQNAVGRDFSWFDMSNKDIVGWSIIPNKAYSAMQSFDNDVRLITRCYIEPEYRSQTMQQSEPYIFEMIKEQIHYAKTLGFNNAFISTEGSRRGVIKRHAKIASKHGLKCELLEGKYKTCEGKNCIQNIGLYKLTEEDFGLPKVE